MSSRNTDPISKLLAAEMSAWPLGDGTIEVDLLRESFELDEDDLQAYLRWHMAPVFEHNLLFMTLFLVVTLGVLHTNASDLFAFIAFGILVVRFVLEQKLTESSFRKAFPTAAKRDQKRGRSWRSAALWAATIMFSPIFLTAVVLLLLAGFSGLVAITSMCFSDEPVRLDLLMMTVLAMTVGFVPPLYLFWLRYSYRRKHGEPLAPESLVRTELGRELTDIGALA